jgi:predicted transcriptional regulator
VGRSHPADEESAASNVASSSMGPCNDTCLNASPNHNSLDPHSLWKVLTAKRWEILRAMCGAGPVTVREVARRVGRDVKSVHSDLTALQRVGVLDKTEAGQVVFPYESVKVEFLLQAA